MVLHKDEFDRLLATGLHDDILRTLPQYNAISASRFDWFDSLSGDKIHDSYWHYQRLFGIGGAESVACLQVHLASQGYEFRHLDFFVDPWDVFKSKTLARPLRRPTHGAMRGRWLEAGVKGLFLEAFDGVEVRDIYDHLRPVRDHSWLIGSPDLLAQVGEELWLVGIEIPGEVSSNIPLSSIARLHHYRNLCTLNQVTPDRMVLGVYDFPRGRVLPFQISLDEQLSRDLLSGGDVFWEMIIRGSLPEFNLDPRKGAYEYGKVEGSIEVSPQDAIELERLEAIYLDKRSRLDEAKAECDELAVGIKSILGKYAITNSLPKGLTFSDITPCFTSEPDHAKVSELVSNGVISPSVFVPESVDVRGLIEAAKSAGVDVSIYVAGTKIDTRELDIELKKAGIPGTEVCDFSVGFANARVSK